MDKLEIEIDEILYEYLFIGLRIDLHSEPICDLTFAIKQNGVLTNKEYNITITGEEFIDYYSSLKVDENIYNILLKRFPNGIYKKE